MLASHSTSQESLLNSGPPPNQFSSSPGQFFETSQQILRLKDTHLEDLSQNPDPFTRHLPAEITSHIFAIYTKNFNSDFDPLYPIVKKGGPLLLGAVSKSWRDIAFGTPLLWNTVNIPIPSTDNLPLKVELTKQWLDRSQQLPLKLSLFYRESSDRLKPEPDSLIPLFNVLQNVAPRWCELVLAISSTFYATFLGELTCAPILDTLKLFDNSDGGGGVGGVMFSLPHTPSLHHLHIRNVFVSEISIEWGNLTTFEADCLAQDDFFEVLRRVQQLNSFRVGALLMEPEVYPMPTTPLTHSALEQLYLETGDTSDIALFEVEALLDLAAFPSLKRFGYRSTDESFFPNRALPSLFKRSYCQLTHFDLSGDLRNDTLDDLIFILSDLPTVTHFKLEESCTSGSIMSDLLLQRLTPICHGEISHAGRLLPRLESLEFLGYKEFSWTSLASLVGATTSDGRPISPTVSEVGLGSVNSIRHISFKVFFHEERELIDSHSVARFKSARDAGISIVIVNESEEPPHHGPPVFFDDAGNHYPFDLLP